MALNNSDADDSCAYPEAAKFELSGLAFWPVRSPAGADFAGSDDARPAGWVRCLQGKGSKFQPDRKVFLYQRSNPEAAAGKTAVCAIGRAWATTLAGLATLPPRFSTIPTAQLAPNLAQPARQEINTPSSRSGSDYADRPVG